MHAGRGRDQLPCGPRLLRADDRAVRRNCAREALVLVAAATAYFGLREAVEGSTARAVANAERLLEIEAFFGIDWEASVQRWALEHQTFVDIANYCYVWLHWPFIIGVFALLLARDPARFRLLRNSLVTSGAIGVVIFATLPTAPPRFMPGFIGTVSQAQRQHYLRYPSGWQNRYASLPSFHVGWTLLASLALAGLITQPWLRRLVLAAGPAVAFAVVVTGNHYIADVIVGTTIAVLSKVAAERWASHRAAPQVQVAPPRRPVRR